MKKSNNKIIKKNAKLFEQMMKNCNEIEKKKEQKIKVVKKVVKNVNEETENLGYGQSLTGGAIGQSQSTVGTSTTDQDLCTNLPDTLSDLEESDCLCCSCLEIPEFDNELRIHVLRLDLKSEDASSDTSEGTQGTSTNTNAGHSDQNPECGICELVFAKEKYFTNEAPLKDVTFREFVISKILYSIRFVRNYVAHTVDLQSYNSNMEVQNFSAESEETQSSESNTNDQNDLILLFNLKPIQLLLERLLVRYWDTRRDFDFIAENQNSMGGQKLFQLIDGFIILCCEEVHSEISKVIISEYLLTIDKRAANNIMKLCFLYGAPPKSAANVLLQPRNQFLEKGSKWDGIILGNVQFVITTKNKLFWTNWADYVLQSDRKLEIMNKFIKGFGKLCKDLENSTTTGAATWRLVPATFCFVALVKKCLEQDIFANSTTSQLGEISIFQEVISLLEYPQINVQCCGAISAIALRELLVSASKFGKVKQPPRFNFKSLSENELFVEFVKFFEGKDYSESATSTVGSENIHDNLAFLNSKNTDSDAETRNFSTTKTTNNDEDDDSLLTSEQSLQLLELENMELAFKSRFQNVNFSTYTEIVEAFIEKSPKNSDLEQHLFKQKALVRLPLLLSAGYKLDDALAAKLIRLVTEFNCDQGLHLPVLLGLYKLAHLKPKVTLFTLAHLIFDRNHFSIGERFKFLESYCQLTQLLSGRKCFHCICSKSMEQLLKLDHVDPLCANYYAEEAKKFKPCIQCRRNVATNSQVTAKTKELATTNASGSGKCTATESLSTKTRRFASPSAKLADVSIDEFSNQFAQFLWAPMEANLLATLGNAQNKTAKGTDVKFSCNVMLVLVEIIIGTSSSSQFTTNVGKEVSDVVIAFQTLSKSRELKLATLRLLNVYLSHTEGNSVALENLNYRMDLFGHLSKQALLEQDLEIRSLMQDCVLIHAIFTKMI